MATTIRQNQIRNFSEVVDDRVASLLVAGSNITLDYNDSSNTITIGATANVANLANALAVARTIALSGDVSGSTTFDGSANATITATLANSGVSAGTYNNVTVNTKGLVTSASNVAYITGNETITVSGDVAGTGTTSLNLTLSNTGVSAGTYNNVTVDAKGRVTAGSNTAYLTENQSITISGDASGTGTNAITLTLANSGVGAGTYSLPTVTVDAKGRVTSIANGSAGVATTANALTTARDISLAGDVSGTTSFDGTANVTITATLANSGVTAGSYNNVTVDAKGRVTAGSNAAYLTTISLTGDATGTSSGNSVSVTLANSGVTAGTYTKVTVDQKGLVTTGASLASTDVTTALGFTPVNKAGDTVSGDLTVSGNLTVNGSTVTVNSTVTTLDDPILTLGGDTAPTSNDGKDRGIEFRWYDTQARTGFFGFDRSTGKLTFIPDATNSSEVFSGTAGTIVASLEGNADTATKLATARTISFVQDVGGTLVFDGTSDAQVVINLANTTVNPGTYNTVTVDSKGRITAGTNTAYLTQNQTITLSGDATGSGSNAISITLSNSGVTAGTYSLATVTVDAKGRVTSVSNGSAGVGSVTSVAVSSSDLTVTGSPITSSGTIALALTNTAVSAGTYSLATVTVDAKGRITAASNGTIDSTLVSDFAEAVDDRVANLVVAGSYVTKTYDDSANTLTLAVNATSLATANTIVVRDANGSFSTNALTASDLLLNGGSGDGLIESDTSLTVRANGNSTSLTFSSRTANGVENTAFFANSETSILYHNGIKRLETTANGVLINSTVIATNFSGNFSGTFTGTIDSANYANVANVANSLATARQIALSGDVSGTTMFDGSANVTITASLANSGVTAGTYLVPTISVDSKGRITSASNSTLILGSSSISDFSEAVDDRVATLLQAGSGITLTYNDSANTLTIASTGGTANSPVFSDTFTANASQTVFTLSQSVSEAKDIIVSRNGLVQIPNTDYTVSANTLTFAAQLEADDIVDVRPIFTTGTSGGGAGSGANTSLSNLSSVAINTALLPATSNTIDIGSSTLRFRSIYVNEAHLAANTLYLDGTPVLQSSSNTITITADPNQSLSVTTTGTGTIILDSQKGTTVQTNGVNADVLIQTSGTGSMTRLTSVTEVRTTAPTIQMTGNVGVTGNTTVTGNLTISGNVTVTGTTTTVDTTNMRIEDNVVTINYGETGTGVTLGTAGLQVDRGDASDALLVFDESDDKWKSGLVGGSLSALATEAYVLANAGSGGTGSSSNTANTLVQRDTNGSFAANVITANSFVGPLTGNVTGNVSGTASSLATARTISLAGDATGSTSFTGTTNVTINTVLANTGVTAGTYNNVTVDEKGRVVAANNTSYIVSNPTITITGDATGSGTTSIPLTLSNSGVTAGSYGSASLVPVITVDAKGRITSVSTTTTGTGTVTSVGISSSDLTVSGSPITTSGTITLNLANSGVTAGSYGSASLVPVITVDEKGRITSISTTAVSGGGGGGSGLSQFVESESTASPNATVPVDALTATDASYTNIDVAIVPKGSGAFLTAVPDSAATGGNKRGTYAVDLQTSRSAATSVASGAYSAIAGGANNQASGSSSFVAGGQNNIANSDYSTAMGGYGTSRGIIGFNAIGSPKFAASGTAQSGMLLLAVLTTSATTARLVSDSNVASASNVLSLANNSALYVKGTIIATTASAGSSKAWTIEVVIKRGASAAATSLVGSAIINTIAQDSGAASWAISVAADTTLGALNLSVTGVQSTNIRWVAKLETTEVLF